MVFEIPEDLNNYDLIEIAVIEQAAQDIRSEDEELAAEAKRWLESDGRIWCDILGLQDEFFSRLMGRWNSPQK